MNTRAAPTNSGSGSEVVDDDFVQARENAGADREKAHRPEALLSL